MRRRTRPGQPPPAPTSGTRRARKGARGQALVEFALVIPVFFLVLAGILDFGFLLYSRMTVINAAREGARAAVVADPAVITTVAPGAVAGVAQGLTLTTTVTCKHSGSAVACNTVAAGDSVNVAVSTTYHFFFPLLFGTTLPLGSNVQMVHE